MQYGGDADAFGMDLLGVNLMAYGVFRARFHYASVHRMSVLFLLPAVAAGELAERSYPRGANRGVMRGAV